MKHILSIIRKSSLFSAVLLLSLFSPVAIATSAYADDPTPVCTPPANNQAGVHWPVGADASTFTYQCDGAFAGLWTNAYYSYDPVSTQRTALYDPNYSYDCSTGTWSMTDWYYSPAQRAFIQARVTPTSAPNLSTGCPVVPTATGGDSSAAPAASGGGSGSSITNTGPNSQNGINGTITLNGSTTNNNTLAMTNGIYSSAASGQTFVIGNTTGGSATSGNAQSIVNLANLLQSSSNVFGPDTNTFVANINGDVNGDFMFDPNAILNTGPNSQNGINNSLTVNTNDTNNTNAQINNTLDVGAKTGDATVANNTSGGNATSGNASAIVNLMNLINSVVSSGKSFVGTININGNLNGDILLPQGLVDQLLANTGPGSINTDNTSITDNSTVTNNTTEGIGNNITSTANTGDATVGNNTSGGTATSGSAGTNVTILNLTGSNTIGKNNLLVFVNVLGHWVGMIVNAPTGSTAASLGGDITSTGPSSQNALNTNITNNSTTTNNTDLGINNNVNVHAASGDASVTGNTSGGNATSGNANTAVNILNLAGSNINLSDWFGVLFINVFGNWTGSFGVNTSAGDPVAAPVTAAASGSGNGGGTAPTASSAAPHTFVSFVSHATTTGSTGSDQSIENSSLAASVLGSHTSTDKKVTTVAAPSTSGTAHANYWIPAIGIIIALLLLLSERFSTLRSNKTNKI